MGSLAATISHRQSHQHLNNKKSSAHTEASILWSMGLENDIMLYSRVVFSKGLVQTVASTPPVVIFMAFLSSSKQSL